MEVAERTCIGCRRCAPRAELIRFVAVDGNVRLDPSTRAPGRGAWVCHVQACFETALTRRAFERALRLPAGRVDAGALRAEFSQRIGEQASVESSRL